MLPFDPDVWVFVDCGNERFVGRVRELDIGGEPFLAVDVPTKGVTPVTHYVRASTVRRLTPMTAEQAQRRFVFDVIGRPVEVETLGEAP